jgi:hypothetical protein
VYWSFFWDKRPQPCLYWKQDWVLEFHIRMGKKGTFYPTMLLGQDLRLNASTFFELMQHFCVSSCVMSNARLWMSPVSSSVFVLYKYQMAPIFKRHCSKSPLNTVTTGGWVEWQHLIDLWTQHFSYTALSVPSYGSLPAFASCFVRLCFPLNAAWAMHFLTSVDRQRKRPH